MNQLSINTLKVLKKTYATFFKSYQLPELHHESDPENVSEIIYNMLMQDRPCMIARFGSTELTTVINYLGVIRGKQSYFKYINGEAPAWWWNVAIMNQMQRWSGFFPASKNNIERFCQLMIEDTKEVDILGSWQRDEYHLNNELEQAQKIQLMYLDPYWSVQPWSRALKGKNVLVIHPFAETIRSQYEKRELLFKNPEILPEFKSLQVIKAVQSLGGESNGFNDWFEALAYMKTEIDKCDYEVCLIGCGAYGFPLAAHVKRSGKKAIHMGGSLQLLFGIRGKRWEDPAYGVTAWGARYSAYSSLMNIYWKRPEENEKTQNAQQVEGACYW